MARTLFLIGAPRSGSTFLTALLNAHPLVHVTNEARLFVLFQYLSGTLLDDQRLVERPYADDLRRLMEARYREIADDLYGLQADAAGKERRELLWLGEKYPHYCDPKEKGGANKGCMDLIMRTYPEARFIHIHRHPFQSVASIMQSGWLELLPAARAWATITKEAIRVTHLAGSRAMSLDYWTLCTEPQLTARRLSDFLGVADLQPWLLALQQNAERAVPVSSPTSTPMVDTGWLPLSAEQRGAVWEVVKGAAARLGYQDDSGRPFPRNAPSGNPDDVSTQGMELGRAAIQTRRGVAVIVVNFNTAVHTSECLASLASTGFPFVSVVLVDNGSAREEKSSLLERIAAIDLPIEVLENDSNVGFAEACNIAIRRALDDQRVSRVLLLNSDAVAAAGMREWLAGASGDICAARVMRYDDPGKVDSLGIVMYRSLIASNRYSCEEPLLGPTGGCALYSRSVLEDLQSAHGYVFDPAFFCYAEDTDLAMRAILLGYSADYHDIEVARHRGQASSGGRRSEFVLYHGIRNSIWAILKCVPSRILFMRAPWIVLAHLGIIVRHVRMGEGRIVVRLYRDAMRGLGRVLRMRRVVMKAKRSSSTAFGALIAPRFYESTYLRNALAGLVRNRH